MKIIAENMRRFLPLNLAAAAAVLLAACSHKDQSSSQVSAPPMSVKVAQPLKMAFSASDEYIAQIEGVESASIRARIGGYIDNIHFKGGSVVKKGDILFSLDDKTYRAQFNLANAELERAKIRMAQTKSSYQRAEKLRSEKSISPEDFDAKQRDYLDAKAAVSSAEANLYSTRVNLDYCQIRSPINGRISRESLHVGDFVNSGDAAVLATAVSTDKVYALLNVPDQTWLNYGGKDQLSVAINVNNQEIRGSIHDFNPMVDAGTSTVKVRAVVDNKDGFLMPGLYVKARIESEAKTFGLFVPEKAVAQMQDIRYLLVVTQGNKVESRQAVFGVLKDGLREVKSGISEGDLVVVEGLAKIKAGASVNPEKTEIKAP